MHTQLGRLHNFPCLRACFHEGGVRSTRACFQGAVGGLTASFHGVRGRGGERKDIYNCILWTNLTEAGAAFAIHKTAWMADVFCHRIFPSWTKVQYFWLHTWKRKVFRRREARATKQATNTKVPQWTAKLATAMYVSNCALFRSCVSVPRIRSRRWSRSAGFITFLCVYFNSVCVPRWKTRKGMLMWIERTSTARSGTQKQRGKSTTSTRRQSTYSPGLSLCGRYSFCGKSTLQD